MTTEVSGKPSGEPSGGPSGGPAGCFFGREAIWGAISRRGDDALMLIRTKVRPAGIVEIEMFGLMEVILELGYEGVSMLNVLGPNFATPHLRISSELSSPSMLSMGPTWRQSREPINLYSGIWLTTLELTSGIKRLARSETIYTVSADVRCYWRLARPSDVRR